MKYYRKVEIIGIDKTDSVTRGEFTVTTFSDILSYIELILCYICVCQWWHPWVFSTQHMTGKEPFENNLIGVKDR